MNDVSVVVEFYTAALGFKLDIFPAPRFAGPSRGDLHPVLNSPGAGGAGQVVPDGQQPLPGGCPFSDRIRPQ